MGKQTEAELQKQVADYLRFNYPDVLFHSDFGSGIKLTAGQAVKQKRMNGGLRGYPDIFVANMELIVNSRGMSVGVYGGLFLELKKEGTRLKKKNGDWATPHIAEQAGMLGRLRYKGYYAEFAVGFDEAKKKIDLYLSGEA